MTISFHRSFHSRSFREFGLFIALAAEGRDSLRIALPKASRRHDFFIRVFQRLRIVAIPLSRRSGWWHCI